MTPFEIIQEHHFLDWATLLAGLERGWCTKEDVVKYAENQLLKSNSEIDTRLIGIINSEQTSYPELISQIQDFLHHPEIEKKESNSALLKWRFAFITSLLEKETSEQEKIALLQEIYSQFGYSEDRISCSVYHNDGIDPLVAAQKVVDLLRKNLEKQS